MNAVVYIFDIVNLIMPMHATNWYSWSQSGWNHIVANWQYHLGILCKFLRSILSNLVFYAKHTGKMVSILGHFGVLWTLQFLQCTLHKHTSQGFHKSDCFIDLMLNTFIRVYVTALLEQLHCILTVSVEAKLMLPTSYTYISSLNSFH